jgi:hypothetical protein
MVKGTERSSLQSIGEAGWRGVWADINPVWQGAVSKNKESTDQVKELGEMAGILLLQV